jgi:hypothetical protein
MSFAIVQRNHCPLHYRVTSTCKLQKTCIFRDKSSGNDERELTGLVLCRCNFTQNCQICQTNIFG